MSYGAVLRREEIDAFKATWPCHGLPDTLNVLAFTYSDNGDLVDVHARSRNGRPLDTHTFDGPALVALSYDAQRKVHPEHVADRT